MIIPRRKQKSGQAGNWDTHPFLRSERVVLRVSPEELLTLEKHRKTHRFDSLAQYLRAQGLKPTLNRPGSTRHFRAVGIDVFRTLPEKHRQSCCGDAWSCRTSRCN